ncbi:hypothetical protein [Phycicoccus sp.]|uniref:hypothetical protein n=1 Tax=Phycicoccus sp. TaxID=1902410 RepID=UPI002C8826F7|nr:hypothetical protein [Phycicoccus sp.]HMM95362.1 hypothetical protein [Phycicoccus sp.]
MIDRIFINRGPQDVLDLVAEHERIRKEYEQTRQRLVGRAREIEQQIDELNLSRRPELPTPAQREGIRNALDEIRKRTVPESHHGDACAPGTDRPSRDVVVDGHRGWLSVQHHSPYSQTRRGGKLWNFTDDEVTATIALIEEEGFTVTKHWKHDEGLSIEVAPGRSTS